MIPSITAMLKKALRNDVRQVSSVFQAASHDVILYHSHERIHPDGGDE